MFDKMYFFIYVYLSISGIFIFERIGIISDLSGKIS